MCNGQIIPCSNTEENCVLILFLFFVWEQWLFIIIIFHLLLHLIQTIEMLCLLADLIAVACPIINLMTFCHRSNFLQVFKQIFSYPQPGTMLIFSFPCTGIRWYFLIFAQGPCWFSLILAQGQQCCENISKTNFSKIEKTTL